MVLDNVKLLLQSLRANDWYITAFRFSFNRHEYIVVFEDLRALNKGTKYYGACLTFLDMANDSHKSFCKETHDFSRGRNCPFSSFL